MLNYGSYAEVFELGISKSNMTNTAKVLLEPIINREGVFNFRGNVYTITSKEAKQWYERKKDIPENIKKAAGNTEYIEEVINYFSEKIIDARIINSMLEDKMYAEMVTLVKESDLENEIIQTLLNHYKNNECAEFLAKTFLYAVAGDNLQKEIVTDDEPIDEDIRAFNELIRKKYIKPTKIIPPSEIETHEIVYVQELYRAYQDRTGECYECPEDLEEQPKLKRDFDRQRKDYYSAETIHRGLRDTICLNEKESFDLLKDEMYDAVINTRDKDYTDGFLRLTAVMEHATQVSLSNNLHSILLNWVGPSEKKGVCHMLVNDKKLSWVEDDDNE